VAVAAVVEAPSGQLTVATTHLSFVPGWNSVQLRRLVRSLAGTREPLVLTGDLNMEPRQAARVSGLRPLAAGLVRERRLRWGALAAAVVLAILAVGAILMFGITGLITTVVMVCLGGALMAKAQTIGTALFGAGAGGGSIRATIYVPTPAPIPEAVAVPGRRGAAG
jgi:hypothetical protein